MPNWCDNKIQISGSEASIKAIKSLLEKNGSGGLFNVLVGHLPDGMTEEEYQKNWYDVNCNRWGCKWDVDIEFESMEFEDDCIYMYIQTAWSPCNGFLRLVHEKYGVDVHNDYSEYANDFAGRFTIDEDGDNDECYTYLVGLYEFDYDTFISEAEIQLQWMIDDENAPAFNEWIAGFDYVNDEAISDLKNVYEENI
jgi:hypothetical protein